MAGEGKQAAEAEEVKEERDVMRPAVRQVLGFLAVLGLASFLLWKVPQWQLAGSSLEEKERIELEDNARGTLAQIFAGLIILLGLYLTYRRISAIEKSVEIAAEGQITERFTRAIGQLGDKENLEVRLGGIYALERIATDSQKDHWTIMEVLTAFIREKARWRGEADTGASEAGERGPDMRERIVGPQTDIQAILTVLGRRTRGFEREDQRLDLRDTDIRKADLSGAHLERAILQHAHLEGANLSGAYLMGAFLVSAHLKGAYLSETHLEGADLRRARMEETDLRLAHVEGANLYRAYLKDAFLGLTHLEGADLRRARLDGASLSGARLKGADLSGAHLREADLSDAHMEETDLQGAHLEGAILLGAHLERAILSRTDLRGADLSDVTGLTKDQIDSAIIDEDTILPDYLKESGHEK